MPLISFAIKYELERLLPENQYLTKFPDNSLSINRKSMLPCLILKEFNTLDYYTKVNRYYKQVLEFNTKGQKDCMWYLVMVFQVTVVAQFPSNELLQN